MCVHIIIYVTPFEIYEIIYKCQVHNLIINITVVNLRANVGDGEGQKLSQMLPTQASLVPVLKG